ncbi:MAG: DNA-processing protein DprA [Firmicutes bacterium]|nr:DNA-processing protein DprA [Bacillota bacterium]
MNHSEQVYWLAWHMILAGQARRFWEIIDHFGGPAQAWRAPDQDFGTLSGMSAERWAGALDRRRDLDLDQVAACLDRNDKPMSLLFYADQDYPAQLKNIYDPPPVLYARGDRNSLHELGVALVGARRATAYGLSVAEKLARELAASGVVVISGMARGIDTAAHRGALKGGGKTAAVLGCGLDVIYPRENAKLADEIAANGVVLSEFPPGSQPEAWHFPVRNRVISGLAKIVVVVEATEKSGALITANVALEQGRDVMAVPGQITAANSRGTNNLIKQGAAVVLDAADIKAELGLGELFKPQTPEQAGHLQMNEDETLISRLIAYDPVAVETLVQKTGLPAGRVLTALMYLEMKGLVRQMPGRLYVMT